MNETNAAITIQSDLSSPIQNTSAPNEASLRSPRIQRASAEHSGFAGETSRLLRRRLIAYLSVSLAVMGLGLVVTMFQPAPMLPMRISVVSTLVAGLLALFTGRDLSLRKLRTI
ncbi:MAG: hypothetical protein AAF664_19670, partial [Planctomycetota bacterium]